MPSLTRIFGNTSLRDVKFQQDNAPCDKAAPTLPFIKDSNIVFLDWPGKSPYLNPIEHLWACRKHKIREHSITSKTVFKNSPIQEWDDTNEEKCARLVNSMPQRIAAFYKSQA